MAVQALLERLGDQIQDPDEETFLLFSREIPSQNLGFVDARATSIDLTIAGKDLVIHQSPTVLTSNREGGTTGAVVWKITPLVADFLASPDNVLRKTGVLSSETNVLELGCGISGLVGLALASSVGSYTLTDQSYVARFVEKNLAENAAVVSGKVGQKRKGKPAASQANSHVRFLPLDWELDQVTSSLAEGTKAQSFDLVVACDCIYNEALIQPLVQTCVDACRLRQNDADADQPAVCLVAQQLRDPDIFEAWIAEFHKHFQTWRLPEEALSSALRSSPGFVVHLGVLRDSAQ